MRKLVQIALCSVFITGCVQAPPMPPVNLDPYEASTITEDKFAKTAKVMLQVEHPRPFLSFDYQHENFFNDTDLTFFTIDSKVGGYKLGVAHYDVTWTFPSGKCLDDSGAKIVCLKVDSQVTSSDNYSTIEYVNMVLSRDYLEQKRNTGFEIKVYGKRGDWTTTVEGRAIDGFLRKVDSAFPNVKDPTQLLKAKKGK